VTEAKRLARNNEGRTFVVYRPVAICKLRDPVEVTALEELDDQIPSEPWPTFLM
jgi:hypothetical protein